jgi:hypothetical protein
MTRLRIDLGLTLALALSASACGELDNETTVKDLRVLAVKAEPAGFLVPLDDPGSIMNTQAKVTALVADPKGQMAALTVGGEACPDFIDTITAATGQTTKVCPSDASLAASFPQLPQMVRDLLATQPLPAGTAAPTADWPIQYEPSVMFGLTPTQIGAFFNDPKKTPTGVPTIDVATGYNRDFSFDAIVNLVFGLGGQTTSVVKRLVYWPALRPDQLPADLGECAYPQVPNQNPIVKSVDFFAVRNEVTGDVEEPYSEIDEMGVKTTLVPRSKGLYVNPTYDPSSAEHYLLRVRKPEQGGAIVTECKHELLTFYFYATAGSFSPATRQSELLPIFMSEDGKVHLDSEWEPPKPEDMPKDGKVTVWVVVRDERAGSSWFTRTFTITD